MLTIFGSRSYGGFCDHVARRGQQVTTLTGTSTPRTVSSVRCLRYEDIPADVFAPPGPLNEGMKGQGFNGKIPVTAVPDVAKYTLRVALNGKACADGTAPCQWLDSQNAIEKLPDWRITKTGTLVSCPLVLFNGKPLGP